MQVIIGGYINGYRTYTDVLKEQLDEKIIKKKIYSETQFGKRKYIEVESM